MNILLDYEKSELFQMLDSFGEPKFRVQQLVDAIYNGKDYGDNINLPKAFLQKLEEFNYIMQPIKIRKAITSSGKDKTIKFLYDLPDGNIIEGVLMNYAFGNTLCVSTQVGCKMNCAFCASGLNGFVRNLSVGEILGQIIAVNRYLGGTLKDRKITNIVLMGSGEPLDNFDNVKKFLKILTGDDCFNMSVRNISLSTCGIPSKIIELADLGYAVTLCLSLHASNDNDRKEIMPIARRYSIAEVLDALKYYYTMNNRRIIIEYTLIDGKNNAMKNAKELSDILKDLPCHVNVIKLNEVEGRDLKSTSSDECKRFVDYLNRFGVSATVRRTLGDDIEGACGQLRNKELRGDEVVNKINPNLNNLSKPKPKNNKVKDARQFLNKSSLNTRNKKVDSTKNDNTRNSSKNSKNNLNRKTNTSNKLNNRNNSKRGK